MDALPVGNYVLIAQNNKDTSEVSPVKSYTTFKVSALAVTQRLLGDNENQYLVLSALNGKPLKDVQIQESFSTYGQNKKIANKGQLLLTNEQGEVFIKNNSIQALQVLSMVQTLLSCWSTIIITSSKLKVNGWYCLQTGQFIALDKRSLQGFISKSRK